LARKFSIITTCKGRLAHLRQSLPLMLAQDGAEVIVVDYCCPDDTAAQVAAEFPAAKVVKVEGQHGFSNWRARNAGATAAGGDLLLFCDADTLLADGALDQIAHDLPTGSFGHIDREADAHLGPGAPRLARNQLRGFHVIPAAAFKRVGGYDEVLEGYAAGGDTDLERRLQMAGVKPQPLPAALIDSVIAHDNADRMRHHADPVQLSYATGLLYRSAKLALLRLRGRFELPLTTRRHLYDVAKTSARTLGAPRDTMRMMVEVDVRPVMMPRQLGYRRGTQKVSLTIEVAMEEPAELLAE